MRRDRVFLGQVIQLSAAAGSSLVIITLLCLSLPAPAQLVLSQTSPNPAPGGYLELVLQGPPLAPYLLAGALENSPVAVPQIGTISLGNSFVILSGLASSGFTPVLPSSGELHFGMAVPAFNTIVAPELYFQAIALDSSAPSGVLVSNLHTSPYSYGPPVLFQSETCPGLPFFWISPPHPSPLVQAFPGLSSSQWRGLVRNLWPGFAVTGAIPFGSNIGQTPHWQPVTFHPTPPPNLNVPNGSVYTATIANPDGAFAPMEWRVYWAPAIISITPTLNLLQPIFEVEMVLGGAIPGPAGFSLRSLASHGNATNAALIPYWVAGYPVYSNGWQATISNWGCFDADMVTGPLPIDGSFFLQYPFTGSSTPCETDWYFISVPLLMDVDTARPSGFEVDVVPAAFSGSNRWAAVGDFDSNGTADLACSSAIWSGNGTPTFGAAFGLDPEGIEVGAADMNGDGFIDLLTTDAPTNPFNPMAPDETVVHLGDGSGSFGMPGQARLTLARGTYDDGGIAIADLNGDGRLDIVVAGGQREVGPGIQVFLSQVGQGGALSYALGPALFTGSRAVVAADFNGDGFVDIVCDALSTSLRILWGNGTGAYATSQSQALNLSYCSEGAEFLLASDIDGDGDQDLLWSGSIEQAVLFNDGIGNFTKQSVGATGANLNRLSQMSVCDINNDGYLDILSPFLIAGNAYVAVSINDRQGGFDERFAISLPNVDAGWVLPVDVDGDGDCDVVVGGNPVTVIENRN